jgi:group I intron endonuclease
MKSELIKSENKYINMYLPKYNILKNAYTSLGYKHTEESRKLMKENYSDERREMIGKLNLGKKFTEETLDKMRKAALNRLSHSEESKLKMVSKTHPIIVKQINDTNIGFKFTNLKIAAKALHCSYKTIQRAVRPDNQFIYIPNTLLPNLTEFSLNNQTEGKIKDNYPYEMVIKDKSGLDKSKGYPKYKIINMREDFSN